MTENRILHIGQAELSLKDIFCIKRYIKLHYECMKVKNT